MFVFSLMQTLVVPALPTIGSDLGVTSLGTGWILTAFLLAGAVFSPVLGNLGDRFGHRRVMLASLALFAAASVVAACAPNLAVLLGARVLQGVSTATFPLALALARTLLTGPGLAQAFGWIPGMIGLGAGVALVVGGIVVDLLSWRWIFVLGALLIAGAALLVMAAVPKAKTKAKTNAEAEAEAKVRGEVVARPTDWAGILLLTGGLVGLLLAVSQGNSWGWASPATLSVGLSGLAFIVALVLVELRTKAPVVDVRTFKHWPTVLLSLLTVVVGFVPFVCFVALPMLMQAPAGTGYGHGMSVTISALAMLPSAVLVFLGGRLTPAFVRRIGGGGTAMLSATVMGIGVAGMALWPTSPWAVIVSFSVMGLGNGVGYAICAQLVVTWSPARETGAAIGLNGVVRTIGSAAAAPVVASILAAGAISQMAPAQSFAVTFWVGAGTCALGVAVAAALVVMGRRAN